ncbi:MAG: DoxX family protein [Candidatus Methylomirabilaceae bacterium]
MVTKVAASETGKSSSKGLHVGLWFVQAILAVMSGLAGVMKSTMPLAELAKNLAWAADVPAPMVRFIGAYELAGALGMVLPSVTRIRPALTPIAGGGLATVMIFATVFHLPRGEASAIGITILLGGLAGLVAWGRFRKAPIAPRA